ncbi:hypothetical protein RHD99_01360 [Buttiauxella selenatireducens]|uniref:Uncharacterized protein n=1 Tax=Buttiauxella selenatireducens TaxID=3073902 RepID=A0ABY9SEV3_9ENTR|nr:hypothetical protein [Buttiauxella sp. R73]WMY74662.1 hypothetical protein RHD99_01360 [Buttiauxella sp. R73]
MNLKWILRAGLFLFFGWLLVIGGVFRSLSYTLAGPYTDLLTSLGLGSLPDYSQRLEMNGIAIYFTLSALLAVLLVALFEWVVLYVIKDMRSS